MAVAPTSPSMPPAWVTRLFLFDSAGPDASELHLSSWPNTGVNTKFVHHSPHATASFNVMTDQDDNQIGGFYPGAMADARSLSLKRWAKQDVFVVIAAHDPAAMREQVAECRRATNCPYMYDPGPTSQQCGGRRPASRLERR